MNVRVKKLVLITALFGVLFVTVAGGIFLVTWMRAPGLALAGSEIYPQEGVHIGSPVDCRAIIEAPWHRWPLDIAVQAIPDGLNVIVSRPPKLTGVGWGTWKWSVGAVVQPYALEIEGPLILAMQFTSDRRDQTGVVDVEFEGIEVTPRIVDGDASRLTAAPPLDASAGRDGRHGWWYWAALGLLCLVILLISISILRRRASDEDSDAEEAHEVALREFHYLKAHLPMAAEPFYTRATDVLRWYLEQQFQLPATEMTTPEFVRRLQSSLELSDEQRELLRDFLTSADAVKFARADATRQQMENALVKAQTLVRQTVAAPSAALPPGPVTPPRTNAVERG